MIDHRCTVAEHLEMIAWLREQQIECTIYHPTDGTRPLWHYEKVLNTGVPEAKVQLSYRFPFENGQEHEMFFKLTWGASGQRVSKTSEI